jgi:quinol monooxygenase YgiN
MVGPQVAIGLQPKAVTPGPHRFGEEEHMSEPSALESSGKEPIVFFSHFRIKDGKRPGFEQSVQEAAKVLQADKPRTLAFLIYADQDGRTVSIVHVFADAASMDIHFVGADQRSSAAYEYIVPSGWEIYGTPSESVVETMRRQAASAGVALRLQPGLLAGFLRLGAS